MEIYWKKTNLQFDAIVGTSLALGSSINAQEESVVISSTAQEHRRFTPNEIALVERGSGDKDGAGVLDFLEEALIALSDGGLGIDWSDSYDKELVISKLPMTRENYLRRLLSMSLLKVTVVWQ